MYECVELRVALANRANDVVAANVRHAEIDHDQVDLLLLQQGERARER